MSNRKPPLVKRSALASLLDDRSAGGAEEGARPLPQALQILVARIRPNTRQPRKQTDPAKLQALAQNIRIRGVLQPIRVRRLPSGSTDEAIYEIIAGERRWRAAQLAGVQLIPAIVAEADDDTAFREAFAENWHREALSPSETIAAILEMQEVGLKQVEIADELGIDESSVSHYVAVSRHPDIWEQVDTLGLQKASRLAAERNRAAGSRMGRPRLARAATPARAALAALALSAPRERTTIHELQMGVRAISTVLRYPAYAEWLAAQDGVAVWELEAEYETLEALLRERPRPHPAPEPGDRS